MEEQGRKGRKGRKGAKREGSRTQKPMSISFKILNSTSSGTTLPPFSGHSSSFDA
jgi:hypothetical protein